MYPVLHRWSGVPCTAVFEKKRKRLRRMQRGLQSMQKTKINEGSRRFLFLGMGIACCFFEKFLLQEILQKGLTETVSCDKLSSEIS